MNEEQKKQLVELIKQAMETITNAKKCISENDNECTQYYVYDKLSRAYTSLLCAKGDLE